MHMQIQLQMACQPHFQPTHQGAEHVAFVFERVATGVLVSWSCQALSSRGATRKSRDKMQAHSRKKSRLANYGIRLITWMRLLLIAQPGKTPFKAWPCSSSCHCCLPASGWPLDGWMPGMGQASHPSTDCGQHDTAREQQQKHLVPRLRFADCKRIAG